jgi:pSer/pThr/pTyr-binding forkhead associated (FHA) protein
VGSSFLIRDIGSTTGTYLKIKSKMTLLEGMCIEMGSNQFRVDAIKINSPLTGFMNLLITEGEEDVVGQMHTINNEGSIGRKPDSSICFENDVHLSNLHAVFSMVNGKFVFEDMSSTNGSWLRLSAEGKNSKDHALQHKGTRPSICNATLRRD